MEIREAVKKIFSDNNFYTQKKVRDQVTLYVKQLLEDYEAEFGNVGRFNKGQPNPNWPDNPDVSSPGTRYRYKIYILHEAVSKALGYSFTQAREALKV